MIKNMLVVMMLSSALTGFCISAQEFSGNPIFTNLRTADASPIVGKDGRLYVITSGDPPMANDYSTMDDYRCYSTDNMVDWTYHGIMLSASNLSWRIKNPKKTYMFAPDIAYKNDKYYLFFPHNIGRGKGRHHWRIGVAISDSPAGPFVDSGQPIKGPEDNATEMRAFDPHCFVDDDGAAYLYWGYASPTMSYAYVARLKDNMTELAESPRQVDIGANNFFEASFLYKRKDKYYFAYNTKRGASYGIGASPYGPFVNKGRLARSGRGAQAHPGIIQYKGTWYYFYQRGDFKKDGIDGSLYRRNVCVDEMHYNPDGTIQEVLLTDQGVERNSNMFHHKDDSKEGQVK